MFYSIIVASYNRQEEISDLVQSFEDLQFPKDSFELIIVDDGSTDDTYAYLDSYIKSAEYNIKFVAQKNKGPGAARNLGMEHARGQFFIFIDSDCTVSPNWLSEIDKELKATQADAFGGPDSYRQDFPPLLKAINYTMTSFLTTGGLRGKKGKKLARFYPRSFNMGLSRQLSEQIGGFGSLRHGQDIEFSHRILKSNAKVVFVENAPVFHKRRTNIRRFYRQVYNWGIARINLYKIDKGMLEPLHAIPALLTILTLIIICLAPFIRLFFYILISGIIIAVMVCIYSMTDSIRVYKEFKPALFIPLILPAQIYGYGLGFINNFFRRLIFRKGEKIGFRKTYYK
jgi:glycosyltransferase involved in cell wall biosynthesis